MKLNKIEKIVIIVLLVGLIIGIGTFVFVVPAYNEIGKSQKKLDNLKTEQQELNAKLARLDTIDADIDAARKEVLELETCFYPELTTYEASEIAMGYIEDCGLDTHAISVSSITTEVLNLETLESTETVYDLKKYSRTAAGNNVETEEGKFTDNGKEYIIQISDVNNVNIVDSEGKEIKKSDYTDTMRKVYQNTVCKYAKASNAQQNVAVVTINYSVDGTYGDYIKFLDYVNGLERASAVSGVTIPMTYTEQKKSGTVDAMGGQELISQLVVCEDDTELVAIPITLKLYCVQPISELNELTIGSGDAKKTIRLDQ